MTRESANLYIARLADVVKRVPRTPLDEIDFLIGNLETGTKKLLNGFHVQSILEGIDIGGNETARWESADADVALSMTMAKPVQPPGSFLSLPVAK